MSSEMSYLFIVLKYVLWTAVAYAIAWKSTAQ